MTGNPLLQKGLDSFNKMCKRVRERRKDEVEESVARTDRELDKEKK